MKNGVQDVHINLGFSKVPSLKAVQQLNTALSSASVFQNVYNLCCSLFWMKAVKQRPQRPVFPSVVYVIPKIK